MDKTLKVLVISHTCVTPSYQQIYVELARQPGVEVQLLVPAKWRSEYSNLVVNTRQLPELTVPFYAMPVAFPGKNHIHFYWRLPLRQIRAFQPDVIFMHQEPWSLVALQSLLLSFFLGCKLTFFTNQNIVKRYPAPFSWINRLIFKFASRAFACGELVTQVLRSKGYKGAINYYPFGVDEQLFKPQVRPSPLRAELGLAPQTFLIGYIGRLIEAKGLQILVAAAGQLAKDANLPDWKIMLVGSGDYKLQLEKLVAAFSLQQKVVFIPPIPHSQVPDLLNCFDVLVLPSLTTPRWREQFGRVIVEALACGVPVVGSDSGEIPYLIAATGGGLISKEGNATSLAASLKQLLCNPAEHRQLVERGKASVAANYTNAVVAANLAEVLKQDEDNRHGAKANEAASAALL